MPATSLDSAGLYHFKHPEDGELPVHFSASSVELTHVSGATKFLIDFLGRFFLLVADTYYLELVCTSVRITNKVNLGMLFQTWLNDS